MRGREARELRCALCLASISVKLFCIRGLYTWNFGDRRRIGIMFRINCYNISREGRKFMTDVA